jgi:hypothetical protein
VYFLLLYEVAHFLSHWRQKLIALVLDSQFPALLVFVISHARNRRAIADALLVALVLADCASDSSPLFESIVSGYLLSIRRRHEASRRDQSKAERAQEAMLNCVPELEIGTLLAAVSDSSNSIVDEREQRRSLADEKTRLKRELAQSKSRARKLCDRQREFEAANAAITQQLESAQQIAANSSVREAGAARA